jgi:predicted CXXCH cytochrome family protein
MPETPAPEGTKPPAFTEVCLNPCDGSEELIWGSYTTSLDNDGDLLVDSMDPDCLNCVTSVVRKIGTPPVDYASLQEAYDFAEGEATLCGNDIAFFEDVSIDAEKSVYFEGGYDCQFGSVVGKSTVIGDLTIYSGTLIIDSGVLELKTTEEVCTDCVDNDSDGLVDCEDSECVGSPLCEVAVPEDHTEEVSGYMHMPGRDDPEANFCTLCHGADLQGDYGPSCNACHFTTHTDDQGSGAMHKPGRQDPVTNLCTICHGIDLNGTILGPSCTACHTADHTEDVGAGIMHKPGKEDPYGTGGCTACHGSDLGGSAIAPSCGSCHGSHTTHLSQTYGPQLTCTNCHGTNAPPMFADGQNLAGTIVCDNCHSVNGVINAKSYWSTPGSSEGIVGSWAATEGYASYCGSCHDGTPGYNGGSAASDVMGDNAGYGFYITGHGLVSGNYPLMYYQEGAGTGNPAAARTCSDCHDLASLHFGSTTKRLMAGYDMDQGNSNCSQCHPPGTVATAAPELYTGSADYEAAGHRTKLCSACHDLHGVISGAYPAMAKEEARALCIACHYAGNPGGLPVPSSPPAEHTDGVTACSSCHNPHKPAHGEAASGDGCIECHGHDSGTL